MSPGTLTVREEDGAECPPNVVGEIFFPAQAGERFHYLGAEVRRDADGRLSLGDLGHIDEAGYLFLSDRRTDLIIRGGANIYPAEVEAALIEYPAVRDAVVIGLPCEEYGSRTHAILELRQDVALEEIDAFLRTRLTGYKCPETYEITDAPLRNEAGKVRRAALREQRLAWIEEARPFLRTPSRSDPAGR